MSRNKKYKNIINQDYLNNLNKAAPMHDIGKIGIPDAFIQKPGRLTEDAMPLGECYGILLFLFMNHGKIKMFF